MMAKKYILAFGVMFGFLILYTFLIGKFFPQYSKTSSLIQSQDIQEQSQVPERIQPDTAREPIQSKCEEIEERIGKYSVSFCVAGGYITNLSINSHAEELLYHNIGYIPSHSSLNFAPRITASSIIFQSSNGLRKEYIFTDHLITLKISQPTSNVVFFDSVHSNDGLAKGYQEVFSFTDDNVKRTALASAKSIQLTKMTSYGARDQYFTAALVKGSYDLSILSQNKTVSVTSTLPVSEFSLYVGPQTYTELKKHDLDSIINYGFFHDIGSLIFNVLHFFFGLFKNWGISIILFAILTYVCLFPFTMMSTKSIKKMQDMQPLVEEIKKKYKDDIQRLNKETVELYKKHKVNPLGGCLPALLQLPVFLALYQVFLRLIELKGASFLWISDLSKPDHAFALPFLPSFYINILPILIMVLGFVQQKFTTTATPSAKDQKMMMMMFPLIMGFIFYNFPASLNLYWFIQNILTFAYQLYYSKSHSAKLAVN